jgi:hypothetical protein
MDTDATETSSTPARAPRSKTEILIEAFGSADEDEIFELARARGEIPIPPLETWTTLKLPYQAPSCPPLPSLDELLAASVTHNLMPKLGSYPICRIGNTVIKYCRSSNIIEVSWVQEFFFTP